MSVNVQRMRRANNRRIESAELARLGDLIAALDRTLAVMAAAAAIPMRYVWLDRDERAS